MSKRIAVLVSGGGTNLQALIDAQARGEIVNGEIVLVISSTPSAYALERAAKAGIPSCVVARKEYPSNQAMTVGPGGQAEGGAHRPGGAGRLHGHPHQ